tara:strand:- start:62 stop:931 length:870 start_codon:yes stop_codon:yes gene_type:complete
MPGISNIFSTLAGSESLTYMHNIYLATYMSSLLLALVVSIFYVIKSINSKNVDSVHTVFNMLTIFALILLMTMQAYRPYYLLVSFLLIVSISFFVTNHLSLSNYSEAGSQGKSEKIYTRVLKLTPFILLTLSFPLSHMAKITLSNEAYDNHHNTIKVLEPNLSADKHIFITTAQLLPLFSKDISIDFYNTRFNKGRNVHWYFPVANSIGARFKDLMLRDIDKETNLMQDAIWGSLLITTSFNKQNTIACLSLKGGEFFINLYNPKILFKDKQNIFLTSSQVSPSDHCFN